MLTQLAQLLGVPTRAAEDALHSEPLAQAYLSRRAFMGSNLALLSSGVVMGLPLLTELGTVELLSNGVPVRSTSAELTHGSYVFQPQCGEHHVDAVLIKNGLGCDVMGRVISPPIYLNNSVSVNVTWIP